MYHVTNQYEAYNTSARRILKIKTFIFNFVKTVNFPTPQAWRSIISLDYPL